MSWHYFSCFCCYKLDISMYCHILHSFSKNCIIQLGRLFFKIIFCIFFLSFLLISIYGFNPAYCLNLMILSTFFNTNLSFSVCFKFLICRKYLILSCKLVISFPTYLIFFIFFFVSFYEIFIKLRCFFNPLQTTYG